MQGQGPWSKFPVFAEIESFACQKNTKQSGQDRHSASSLPRFTKITHRLFKCQQFQPKQNYLIRFHSDSKQPESPMCHGEEEKQHKRVSFYWHEGQILGKSVIQVKKLVLLEREDQFMNTSGDENPNIRVNPSDEQSSRYIGPQTAGSICLIYPG